MNERNEAGPAPLAGLRVLEFTQTVMGPSAGLVLADLGADVIKVEPAPRGDPTRTLTGFAAGFFGFYNRNKRSLAVDLKRAAGKEVAHRLALRADVIVENFAPETMRRLGCDYDALAANNQRLIYCELKGFLAGPNADDPALDEVVQYRSGLAYMTGPPGQPMRAGASIVDIMGGMFGVVGILAALRERDRTGRGQLVRSALFESSVFLMGQHMAAGAILGETVPPMPARRGVWGIYQPFRAADGELVFIAVTSDAQWARFCEAFARPDLLADPRLATNASRAAANSWFAPIIAEIVSRLPRAELIERLRAANVPCAPVARIEDLPADPQLAEGGGLVEVELPGGARASLPRLPLEMSGAKTGLRREAPRLGEHSREILTECGLGAVEIDALIAGGTVTAA